MAAKKTPVKKPATNTVYICFDLCEDYIDNVCYEDDIRDAKRYDFYLTVLVPKDGSGKKSFQIGTVDLTIPRG